MRLEIERKVLPYRVEELAAWEQGERGWCSDSRCRSKGHSKKNPLPQGPGGYAEAVVGRYFEEELGLEWVHQEFDVFGINVYGKYPRAQHIIETHLRAMVLEGDNFNVARGEERVRAMRNLYRLLGPITAPDIMAWNPGGSGLRFAEAKLVKTRNGKESFADDLDRGDKHKTKAERWGLLILARYFRCPVNVFWVVPQGCGLESEFVSRKGYEL